MCFIDNELGVFGIGEDDDIGIEEIEYLVRNESLELSKDDVEWIRILLIAKDEKRKDAIKKLQLFVKQTKKYRNKAETLLQELQ